MGKIDADKKQKNDKLVFIVSVVVAAYIFFMILSYRLGFDGIVIIGVFRELLDIPAFALLGISFILSVISFTRQKFKLTGYPFYSILIVLITITGLAFLT